MTPQMPKLDQKVFDHMKKIPSMGKLIGMIIGDAPPEEIQTRVALLMKFVAEVATFTIAQFAESGRQLKAEDAAKANEPKTDEEEAAS